MTSFKPDNPAFVSNPYPTYAKLRKSEPVHRTREGYWMVTKYELIRELLANSELSNAPAKFSVLHARYRDSNVAADLANNILPFLDPPEHTEKRRLLNRVLQKQMAEMRPAIESICGDILASLRDQNEFDVISDYGTPVSIQSMMQLIGIPPTHEKKLKKWSALFFYLFAPIRSAQELAEIEHAIAEFRSFLTELIQLRKKNPCNDLISNLIGTSENNDANSHSTLSEKDIIDNCILIFADGIENVDRALGTCVAHVMENPAIFASINEVDDYERFVSEALRLDSPAQLIARISKSDITVGGQHIDKDSIRFLAIGAANRDPERFDAPDEFNIDRPAQQDLVFGAGRHSCLGASLVNMQLTGALMRLFAQVQLISPVKDNLEWENRFGHRWLKQYRIKVNWL